MPMPGELWPNYSSNLQGLWHLSDVNDSSANAYNLTNNGTTTFPSGKFGNGGLFNGTNQSLSIADASCANLEISGDITAMYWFKPNVLSGAIICKGKNTNSAARKLHTFIDVNKLRCLHLGLTTNSDITNDTILAIGQWYFGCFVYDSTEQFIKLWVNGNLAKLPASGVGSDSNAPFTIACDTFGGGDTQSAFFSGMIDEVAIYNRAWKDKEIINYYAWAKGLRTSTL